MIRTFFKIWIAFGLFALTMFAAFLLYVILAG